MVLHTAREEMLAGLPAKERSLDVAGVATRVWEVGDGPAILLLHGGIECAGVMWAPAARHLAQRHRVVVPDVPGLGESAPAPRLDVDTFAGWLAALSRSMRLERPVIVAHSLVGSLAASVAARRSLAAAQLVIYAAPGIGPYRMPARLRYLAVRFAIRPTAANAERFDRFALHDYDATRDRDPQWFDAFASYTVARARVRHVKRTMRQLVGSQTRRINDADLARVSVPATLLWGRHDRMVPIAVAHHAATRHGWPLHVVDDTGHAPHIERPEAFCAELTAIIAGTARAGT
jgi:pimeloyl-ACP methyl ester carboxylesterase